MVSQYPQQWCVRITVERHALRINLERNHVGPLRNRNNLSAILTETQEGICILQQARFQTEGQALSSRDFFWVANIMEVGGPGRTQIMVSCALVTSSVLVTTLAATTFAATRPTPIEADIAWVASGEFCESETILPLPDNTLLVSNVCDFRERGNGFLTLLDADGHALDWRIVDGLDAPLGMALDGEHLHVGGARLWCVDLRDDFVKTLGPDWLADIDGIEFGTDGTLQITPVAGPLVRYRNDNDIEVLAGEGVSSANHGYSADLKLALIPTGFDNTVIAIRLSDDRQ